MGLPEVIVVFGHGLCAVRARGVERASRATPWGYANNGRAWVEVVYHGYSVDPDPPHRTTGRWFWVDETRPLTTEEAREALQREQANARARNVACNDPDCWCRAFTQTSPAPASAASQ